MWKNIHLKVITKELTKFTFLYWFSRNKCNIFKNLFASNRAIKTLKAEGVNVISSKYIKSNYKETL